MPCYCVPSLVSQLAYYIKGKPVGYRLIRTYDFYFITIQNACKAITAADGYKKINPRPEGWAGIYKKGGEEHMKNVGKAI